MDLNDFRQEINKIDLELLNLIKKRMNISRKIGKFKRQNNLLIFDSQKEKEIFEELENLAKKKDLDKDFIKSLFKLIMNKSKKEQKCQKI
ncbi:MAG: chorismate mutase [archaeon]